MSKQRLHLRIIQHLLTTKISKDRSFLEICSPAFLEKRKVFRQSTTSLCFRYSLTCKDRYPVLCKAGCSCRICFSTSSLDSSFIMIRYFLNSGYLRFPFWPEFFTGSKIEAPASSEILSYKPFVSARSAFSKSVKASSVMLFSRMLVVYS